MFLGRLRRFADGDYGWGIPDDERAAPHSSVEGAGAALPVAPSPAPDAAPHVPDIEAARKGDLDGVVVLWLARLRCAGRRRRRLCGRRRPSNSETAPLVVAGAAALAASGVAAPADFLRMFAASVLVIAWLNLSNDAFDAATGVDADGRKPESVVNLLGGTRSAALKVLAFAKLCLAAGAALFAQTCLADAGVAWRLALAVACGPPPQARRGRPRGERRASWHAPGVHPGRRRWAERRPPRHENEGYGAAACWRAPPPRPRRQYCCACEPTTPDPRSSRCQRRARRLLQLCPHSSSRCAFCWFLLLPVTQRGLLVVSSRCWRCAAAA